MKNPFKILIVEDSNVIIERLNLGLSTIKWGNNLSHADNSIEAIDKYFEIQPIITILDLMLKSGNGFEVLESVKCRSESNIVIVFTSHANSFIKQSCINLGADYFLDKSNDYEQLLSICNDFISKHNSKHIFKIKHSA